MRNISKQKLFECVMGGHDWRYCSSNISSCREANVDDIVATILFQCSRCTARKIVDFNRQQYNRSYVRAIKNLRYTTLLNQVIKDAKERL